MKGDRKNSFSFFLCSVFSAYCSSDINSNDVIIDRLDTAIDLIISVFMDYSMFAAAAVYRIVDNECMNSR